MGALDQSIQTELHEIVERLTGLPDALRQTVSDGLWANIPTYVREGAWNAAATQISATPQNDLPFLVTSIVTFIAGDNTGWLQLGNTDLIPVPAGGFNITDTTWILQPSDPRALFIGTPGSESSTPAACAFWLFGTQMPTYSRMAP